MEGRQLLVRNKKDLLVLCLPLIWSCCVGQASQPDSSLSITITFIAEDLSEDNKLFSTRNDEIVLQIYEKSTTASFLPEPLVYQEILFDQQKRQHQVNIGRGDLKNTNSYIIYWIEYESNQSFQRRTPVYRLYHNEINTAYKVRQNLILKKYLGTDDLLGVKELRYDELIQPMEFLFEGILNLEKYRYTVRID